LARNILDLKAWSVRPVVFGLLVVTPTSSCCRDGITSCAKGRDSRINRRIDPLVEIIAGQAVTSQIIDRISRDGRRNYGNTALIEFTSHLEQHFGRRVVDIIDTSKVENETLDRFFRSGDEAKNLFDEKVGICIK